MGNLHRHVGFLADRNRLHQGLVQHRALFPDMRRINAAICRCDPREFDDLTGFSVCAGYVEQPGGKAGCATVDGNTNRVVPISERLGGDRAPVP